VLPVSRGGRLSGLLGSAKPRRRSLQEVCKARMRLTHAALARLSTSALGMTTCPEVIDLLRGSATIRISNRLEDRL